MIVLSEIQKRLAEHIKTCGMTQTAIAKRLNLSQSTIAHYVKGDIMPALDTFANLCVVLDVDPSEILGTSYIDNKKALRITNSFNNNSGDVKFNA